MKARWPVQQRLAVLLQRHPTLAGVKVTPSPPTQMTSAAEHVFCVGTTGSLTAGPLVSGRRRSGENTIWFEASGRPRSASAEWIDRISRME